jgi:hypothetical protein
MLRRNKHRGPRPRIAGRRRLLDPEKKVELCEHVAKGASVEDAAETVCVSLRTVQRERRLDEDFDHELQLSLRQAPDPLKMMQHAARAHWRAAAWLLERTDPEQYAKRPKSSISPAQFHAGLEFVMEAALAGIPPELHEQVYEYMTAPAEEAHECLFPNHGRWGDAKRPKLRRLRWCSNSSAIAAPTPSSAGSSPSTSTATSQRPSRPSSPHTCSPGLRA